MAKQTFIALLIALFCLFNLAESKVKIANEDKLEQSHGKRVVQSNHYYSDTDKDVSYNVDNVVKDLPLVLILKNKQSSEGSDLKNPTTFILKSGDYQSECLFERYEELCVIPKVLSVNISMQIKCSSLPCQASWVIYQPTAKTPNGTTTKAEDLYDLQKSGNHMMAIVSCNDPIVKTLEADVTIYSQSRYERFFTDNVIYFLFNNLEKGFMYIDIKQTSKKCAQLSTYNVPVGLKLNDTEVVKDFSIQGSPSVLKILQFPEGEFRIDLSMHAIDKSKLLKSPVHLKLTASKDSKRETLVDRVMFPVSRKNIIDASISFKPISKEYSDLQIIVETTDEPTAINLIVSNGGKQQIQLGEVNYFSLKKGESMPYQVMPENDAKDSDLIYFLGPRSSKFRMSNEECPAKKGCQFTITAVEDVSQYIYLSNTKSFGDKITEEGLKEKDDEEIQWIPLKNSVTKKIREGDNLYFTKQITKGKAIQVVVNNPNVIVFGARKEKCPVPDNDCFERHANIHRPFIFQPEADGEFLFNVQGLDNCEFALTIIDGEDKFIKLNNSVPFSYVMDEKEDKVLFQFQIKEKEDVNFNLLAAVNSLNLLVNNGKKEPTEDSPDLSSEGFIEFTKDQIDSKIFTISVVKSGSNKAPLTHFSIIASTASSNLRLEPGTTHYQTISPSAHRDFVFEFDPKEDYLVNFYTHNLKEQTINLELLASYDGKWTGKDVIKMVIDTESDVLDLEDVSKELCEEEGEADCQIFLRVVNTMDIEIDITLTLLVRDAIIELKDGLWQSYNENQIAISANFYFMPKSVKMNTVIMYKSALSDIRLVYTIWKVDNKNLYPSQWPFPDAKSSAEKKNSQFKPISYVTIDHQVLKDKCWPKCVILITLFKDTSIKGSKTYTDSADFRIMASNSQIQIPEKTKINLVLKKDEEKQFMIDLKYILSKEQITFYTTSSLGFYSATANVYSERKPRCPTDDDTDFYFGETETKIEIQTLKREIAKQQIEDNNNLFLCVKLHSYQNCKMSIQYTTDDNGIKKLEIDSFEEVALKKNQPKFYRIDGTTQFYLKIIRNSGFPFVFIKKCKGEDIQECMQAAKTTEEKGKQLVTKTEAFDEEPCQDCSYIVKLSAEEPADLNLHLQSKYTQLELKQNEIVTDFTNENEENRYLITAVRSEETIINLNILEGEVEVRVIDFQKINITRTSDKDHKIVHILVASKDHAQTQVKELGDAMMSPFTYSGTFNYLHLSIRSKDPKAASYFTIFYSSGQRQLYLQDGMVTDYTLESKKPTLFYYSNEVNSDHIYFSISASDSSLLNEMKIKTFYLANPTDSDSKTQFKVQRPPMRKKTPNPTILMALPKQNFFIFQLQNPSGKDQKVSVGINHQQVILLPFSHEFPFTLHNNEDISMLVDVNIIGFLKISIRKCDQSTPIFSYTFDYDGFMKGDFTYQTTLSDDPKFQYMIKANKIGTLYLKLKSDADQSSLLSINVQYSEDKVKKQAVKPGNKGLIQYVLTDGTTAELSFSPLICSGKKCSKNIKYYSISSGSMQQLYSQLVCPSSFFVMAEAVSSNPLPLTKIEGNTNKEDKISFKFSLLDHISYIGVKGVYENGQQVYYKPIEVITVWGQISRTSHSHKLTIAAFILVSLCVLIIFVRKNARKGYQPLNEGNQ